MSDLALTHFNLNLPKIVAASKDGIRAMILHKFPDGKVKAEEHVLKTLTATEQNYRQIEKEVLIIIFEVKKFYKMIYGRNFTLQTVHIDFAGPRLGHIYLLVVDSFSK